MGGTCITRGRFWGGKGLESEKDVLEEKELLGVNIIGVLLPEELLGLIRLLVCLSLLLKAIITIPSEVWFSVFYLWCGNYGLSLPLFRKVYIFPLYLLGYTKSTI